MLLGSNWIRCQRRCTAISAVQNGEKEKTQEFAIPSIINVSQGQGRRKKTLCRD